MPSLSTRSRRERGLGPAAAALCALLLASADVAVAAPPPDTGSVRQSREHYRKGNEAYAAGRYEDAYREFEAGYALVSRPVFLLNMAHSERRRGNLSNARALYQKFLLVEPQSEYASEVQQVIQELDGALAAEQASRAPPAAPVPEPLPVVPPAAGAPVAASVAVVATPLPPPRPLYRRWWVWAAAGGVVAAAVGTALLLGRASYQKDGSLGTLGSR
jgi:tetratricopeptide (TPR) repeat protein